MIVMTIVALISSNPQPRAPSFGDRTIIKIWKTAPYNVMINDSTEDGIWDLEIVESEIQPFLSPTQQAGMYLLQSIVIIALFIISCDGFNISIPSKLIVKQPTSFHYNLNTSDFNPTQDGVIADEGVGVFLISGNVQCPESDFVNGFGSQFSNAVDGKTVVKRPQNDSDLSGNLVLKPKKPGLNPAALQGVVFLFNSSSFNVENENSTSSSTFTTSSLTTAAGAPTTDNDGGYNKFQHHDDHSGTIKIVGGVVGGVAAICLGLAIFFYRRFRYQRKVNQFHKEHMLLNQQPPPSMSSTLGYPAYNARVTSPPPGTVESPTSPRAIRPLGPHVPLGFDETMQKSYHFPSAGSSPSSFSCHFPTSRF
ncbi:hypothetical protein V5O48_012197 [Marasmius crinis-equi]|uniref:Mid2 domain-containing protein n=1 Tax=Marasmius crinis-equi TaxID=585013 RepID=A0ABR3F423_9AGAR